MFKSIAKSALPHFIAVVIFALVAIIYCKPALDSKVLQQTDVTQWKGMAQDALNHKEKTGITPLWTKSMFGGMPTYQITGIPANKVTIGALDGIMTLTLPEPIGLFFLASICFYFLAQVLGFNFIISIIGALGYSYATYNPIIVSVGHITKMHAIAYLPFFIGSILLLFQKKYLSGGTLIAISTALFIQANHLQIAYYGLIIVLIMSIFYLIQWIKQKEYKHLTITLLIGIIAGGLGLAVNAPMLTSTYEYGKESIRGGSALSTKDSKTTKTGLNKDYALSYSMYKTEPLVLLFPNLYGGGSDPNTIDPEKSKAIEVLQQMQPNLAQQLQSIVQFYWGGIGITSGPPYAGIIICVFALIGFSVKANQQRWWIAIAIIFSFLLAAGSYLETFNVFILNYFPLYNKFRAPSMILVIPTLLLGIMALYGLEAVTKEENLSVAIKKYKPSLIVLGLIIVSVCFIYLSSDFKSENDKILLHQISQITDPNQRAMFETPANDLVKALVFDRKSMVENDLIKLFIYLILIAGLLILSFKKIINQTILLVGLGILSMVDLFQIDTKYLKSDHFIEATENENVFILSPLDIALKKDSTEYRVLDLRNGIQNAFNGGALIAYHHKTVGGYNPAKLSIYQDLIENQWYKYPNCNPTMNMLNTKYVITGNLSTDTISNKNALGNAWFVKEIAYEEGPAAVMNRLSNFNPKTTAVVEAKDKITAMNSIQLDTAANIQLIANNNDEVLYKSASTKKQFAVFSEVYYEKGWKAFIDNQETPIIKTNYVLRGLVIEPGIHAIKFEFNPSSIETAKKISVFSSLFLWISLLIIIFISSRKIIRSKNTTSK